MIPAKNIFCGSLGKIEKTGGSRYMTTPHTVTLNETSYTLKLPVSGDFICCTLNGKLYLYKAEGIYIIEALKWNADTGQLEHAATDTLSIDENILARGIDWILTSYSIIQAIDDEPYIVKADLISRNGSSGIGKRTKFCYSLLRSQFFNEVPSGMNITLGSGLDPFTRQLYGVDGSDNGNTEGWGYFSTNLGGVGLYLGGTRTMEGCYSTLPAVGDWNIIEDFLVRRPINPINDAENEYHFFMKQVRPLIPLEFNLYDDTTSYPSYGTGYNTKRRGIQLASFNNEMWGRGLMHAGRVCILPAAFGDNGEPEEFYLYIGADIGLASYNQKLNPDLDENNEWLSVGVAALKVYKPQVEDDGNNSDTEDSEDDNDNPAETNDTVGVGFLSEKLDPLKCGICSAATSEKIFFNGEWITPRENDTGTAAFDSTTGMGLILGRTGVSFIEGGIKENTVVIDDDSQENTVVIDDDSQENTVVIDDDSQENTVVIDDDSQENTVMIDDYTCSELTQWLSPTGRMESIDKQICMSSCDNGLLVTNIMTGFNRLLLQNRILCLAWEIFNKTNTDTDEIIKCIKLSIGQNTEQTSDININNIAYPDHAITPVENILWEDIYKQAVDIKALNVQSISFFRMIDGLPIIISSLQQDIHYGRMGYGTVTKSEYNKQKGGPNGHEYYSWSLKDTYNLIFIDPDTGEFKQGSVEIDLSRYYTIPGEPMYPMWHKDIGYDAQGRLILLNTYSGISMNDIVTYVQSYPVWSQEQGWGFLINKYKNYYIGWDDMNYSGGHPTYSTELIFVPIATENAAYNFPEDLDVTSWYAWDFSDFSLEYNWEGETPLPYYIIDGEEYSNPNSVPWIYLRYLKPPCLDIIGRFFFAPDIVSKEITQGNMSFANNMICYPYLAFTEASTKTKFLLKSSLFGGWTNAGKLKGIAKDIYNSNNQQWIFGAQPLSVYQYSISPITDYKGETRYEKTLYLIILDKDDGWSSTQCIVIRADVNSDIFDFNSELLKSKLKQEGAEDNEN